MWGEITFWYILGIATGMMLGCWVGITVIKYFPGPPMRIQEEHGVSRYNKEN